MHCTPIHIPCEKGNFAIVISITWHNCLIINKIKELQFRENSGDFVHWYEDSRSGNQTERKSGNEA